MAQSRPHVASTERIKVSIETRTSTIVGTVHLPAVEYRSRLSDLLTQQGTVFLNVTDATVYTPRDAENPSYKTSYLAVNLGGIEIVRPLD
ncbi:MAG: hypothetical protein IBX61_01750 [Thermoleophilia bacterium]|nr:hypothetical protein [Thermoleophilia bacterium]